MTRLSLWAALGLALASGPVLAAEAVIPVDSIDANGAVARIGSLAVKDTAGGLLVTPRLTGLTPGPHGFHVHENPSCAAKEHDGKPVAGLAAGGHFDPDKTGKHEGPWGHGHEGDMPALAVNGDGAAVDPVLVPRL